VVKLNKTIDFAEVLISAHDICSGFRATTLV